MDGFPAEEARSRCHVDWGLDSIPVISESTRPTYLNHDDLRPSWWRFSLPPRRSSL